MLCLSKIPIPPPKTEKQMILCGLFVTQLIYEYSSESLVNSVQNYTDVTALTIATWSSVPAFIFSASWCTLNEDSFY